MKDVVIYGKQFAVPSLFRLPMYIHYLVETLKLLDQWAEEFPFSAPALRDSRLAADLACSLDAHAAQQMVAELERCFVPAFQGWDQQIPQHEQSRFMQYCYCRFCLVEDENPKNWNGQLSKAWWKDFRDLTADGFLGFDCFRAIPESRLHPITLLALRHESESLWNSIAFLCRRLDRTLPDLGNYFFEGRIPRSLARIQPCSRERHKGGGRSLVLRFWLDSGQFESLVYKPFDSEKDFLSHGDMEHAWRLLSGDTLQDPVILESLKWCRDRTGYGSSILTRFNRVAGADLPVPKILACVPGSALKNDDSGRIPQLRESYGFMEYRVPDEEQVYPANDAGMLAALAHTFSWDQCHSGNLTVYQGRLVASGLEHHAFGLIPSPTETLLPETLRGESRSVRGSIKVEGGFGGLKITWQNPLEAGPAVVPDQATFRAGYARAMKHLIANAAEFLNALSCFAGVVSRVAPYQPAEMDQVLLMLSSHACRFHADGTARVVDVAQLGEELTHHGTAEMRRWSGEQASTLKAFGDPRLLDRQQSDRLFYHLHPCFCVFSSRALLLDGVRGDIPAFYHRLDSRELMGSDGSIIRFSLPDGIEPEVRRAMVALYGESLIDQPYFPRNSLSVMTDHLRRLAGEPAYAEGVTRGAETEAQS